MVERRIMKVKTYNESKESASLIHNIMDGGKENEETI